MLLRIIIIKLNYERIHFKVLPNYHSIHSDVIFNWIRIIRIHRRSSIFSTLGRNNITVLNSNQTNTKIMNIIMFIVGALIFVVFLIGVVWEAKTEEKVRDKNYGYYARHQPEKDELEKMN